MSQNPNQQARSTKQRNKKEESMRKQHQRTERNKDKGENNEIRMLIR